MKLNRECICCRKKYSYCPNCDADRLKPRWYWLYCSELCKDVDYVLSEHTFKRMSDKDAAEALKILDLDNLEMKDMDNQAHIDQLLKGKDTKVKKDAQ